MNWDLIQELFEEALLRQNLDVASFFYKLGAHVDGSIRAGSERTHHPIAIGVNNYMSLWFLIIKRVSVTDCLDLLRERVYNVIEAASFNQNVLRRVLPSISLSVALVCQDARSVIKFWNPRVTEYFIDTRQTARWGRHVEVIAQNNTLPALVHAPSDHFLPRLKETPENADERFRMFIKALGKEMGQLAWLRRKPATILFQFKLAAF
jgi:hypothetical protein